MYISKYSIERQLRESVSDFCCILERIWLALLWWEGIVARLGLGEYMQRWLCFPEWGITLSYKTLFSELQFPKGSVVSQCSWEPSVQMPETRRDILHLNIPNILSWVSHNVCFTVLLFSQITSYFRSRSYLIPVCCMETGTLTTKLPFQLMNNFL